MAIYRWLYNNFLVLSLGLIDTSSAGLLVSAPERVPLGASQIVDHAFGSFSFAVHVFADYAGNSTIPNLFSRNLIDVLTNKTGKAPYIRVGGTSADRTNYISNQTQGLVIQQEGPNGIPLAVTVGPVFFEGFLNFPGSKFHYDLNLAQNNSNGILNAVAEAKIALKYIGKNLESFEIGNECDLYVSQSVRPPNYTELDYVTEWIAHASDITEQVLALNEYGLNAWTIYQALTYAGGPNAGNFSLISAFNNSHINAQQRVKSASLHHYQAGHNAALRLQNDFMNHSAISGNLTQYIAPMAYLRDHDPSVTFVIGESNSDFVNLGILEYTGVFGNALWVCDYLLFGMSLNISRIYLHQGTTFGYSAWVPVAVNGSAPQVRPPYYGNLLVADVVGISPSMQVLNVDLGMWNVSAYATFEEGILAKYVVINFDEWNTTTSYPRPTHQVSLNIPADVATTKVEYLTAPGTEVDQNITWGGLSYGFDSMGIGVQVTNNTKMLTPVNGVLNVSIQSTEAIVVTLLRANASNGNNGTASPTSGADRSFEVYGNLVWGSTMLTAGLVFILMR